MIDHGPHIENARRALAYFDAAPTGAEVGRRAVKVASALRVLLYEPADGYEGYFIERERKLTPLARWAESEGL